MCDLASMADGAFTGRESERECRVDGDLVATASDHAPAQSIASANDGTCQRRRDTLPFPTMHTQQLAA